MSPTETIVAFTVRLPEPEHRALVALAEREHRPLNAQVRKIINEALAPTREAA